MTHAARPRLAHAICLSMLALAAPQARAQTGLTLLPRPALGITADGVDLNLLWRLEAYGGPPLNLVAGRQLLPPVPARQALPSLGSSDLPAHRFSPDDFGFIGLQFKDGTRLTLRRQGGSLGLSYRTTF